MTMTFPTTAEDWQKLIAEREAPAKENAAAKRRAEKHAGDALDNPFLTMAAPTEAQPEPVVIDGHDEQGNRVLDLASGEDAHLDALIAEYLDAADEEKAAKDHKELVRKDIEKLLGDSPFKGELESGSIAYTFPTPRKTLDKKRFEEEQPQLAEMYARVSSAYMKEGKRTPRLVISAPKEK